jgi:hypothetical protein
MQGQCAQLTWCTHLTQPCGSVVAVTAVPNELERALQVRLLCCSGGGVVCGRRRRSARTAARSAVIVEGRGCGAAASSALRSRAAQARDFVAQPRACNFLLVAACR